MNIALARLAMWKKRDRQYTAIHVLNPTGCRRSVLLVLFSLEVKHFLTC